MLKAFSEKNLLIPAKKQMLLGILCWVMYQLGFALLFMLCFDLNTDHGYYQFEMAVMCSSFILTAICFLPFLVQSFAQVRFGKLLADTLKAYGLYWVISFALSIGIVLVNLFLQAEQSNPNQEAIDSLVSYSPVPMVLCTVLLVPVLEECLIRGMIFAPLCRKSPLLAYVVSAAFFALLHVIAGLGSVSWITMLLNFVGYLPSGIVLGWMYQRTRTIAGPIVLHCFMNLMASVLSYLM